MWEMTLTHVGICVAVVLWLLQRTIINFISVVATPPSLHFISSFSGSGNLLLLLVKVQYNCCHNLALLISQPTNP
jgi:hypothetical protein